MRNTSLCYIERDGKYLMMHRIKKKNDVNYGKWVGIGGGFERGESPEECAAREIFEETGLTVGKLTLRGVVTFVADSNECEYMFLFTCRDFSGDICECDEGALEWVNIEDVTKLPIWEGDRIFLELLKTDAPFFSLKLVYEGESLTFAVLDGEKLEIRE